MIEYENLAKTNAPFAAEIKAAIDEVVNSGWFVLGRQVDQFEQEFASYVGSKHCIGVANGLDALTLSIKALDLPRDSEILVASNTYIATILAIVEAGLKPVLVEPDVYTYNIDPSLLSHALTSKTRAICITHLYGKSCCMDEIMNFANSHGLYLIEDCAQSHSAKFRGQHTGTFGISGCFSFYPTKNLGALGDAGAIVTSDDKYAEKLRHLRNYGSTKKYVNVYAGVNSRLDELQAAVLRVKLKHLTKITEHKRALAEIYFELLPNWLRLPQQHPDYYDVFHIFAVAFHRRDELKKFMLENGVKTEIHYPIPPHRQLAMASYLSGDYPVADKIHAQELSLPISYATSQAEVRQVSEIVSSFQ
ncbi:DegT/DnrJ/EryC1/StrS family aminotransferase [Chromobacterium violaceum]|uniref:DegT/DnrJ/EryC1/StrS family aminotransferase n=1 Tax=Chromobacterium violaceum TaxID=536 RepID=UPI0035A73545